MYNDSDINGSSLLYCKSDNVFMSEYSLIASFYIFIYRAHVFPGPSPPIKKWSGGGSHPVPKAREVGEHERGIIPPLVRGGGLGGLPRENFLNFERFYVRF